MRDGHFENLPLFRCLKDFLCQFGATLPGLHRKVYSAIADDPKRADPGTFKPGYLSFAGSGPNTRNKSYGDMPPYGQGPDPRLIETESGADYLKANFPDLDYILSCAVER